MKRSHLELRLDVLTVVSKSGVSWSVATVSKECGLNYARADDILRELNKSKLVVWISDDTDHLEVMVTEKGKYFLRRARELYLELEETASFDEIRKKVEREVQIR